MFASDSESSFGEDENDVFKKLVQNANTTPALALLNSTRCMSKIFNFTISTAKDVAKFERVSKLFYTYMNGKVYNGWQAYAINVEGFEQSVFSHSQDSGKQKHTKNWIKKFATNEKLRKISISLNSFDFHSMLSRTIVNKIVLL